MVDGESLPGPPAKPTAGDISRDLESIVGDEAGLQRCPREVRKLFPMAADHSPGK